MAEPRNRKKKETNKLYFDNENHEDEFKEPKKRKKKTASAVSSQTIVEPSPDVFEMKKKHFVEDQMPKLDLLGKEKKKQKKVRFDIPEEDEKEISFEPSISFTDKQSIQPIQQSKSMQPSQPLQTRKEQLKQPFQTLKQPLQQPLQKNEESNPTQAPLQQPQQNPQIGEFNINQKQASNKPDFFSFFSFLSKKNPVTFSLSDLPIPPTNSTPVNDDNIWSCLSKSPSSSIYYDKKKNVIIKVFSTSQEFKKEVWCLDKLKNYSFVPKVITTEKENFILVMSYCGKKLTKTNKPANCYEQIKHIERVLALECIYHNDIETRNFVVDDEDKIYIIDFAISSLMHPTKPARNDFLSIFVTLDCSPKINIDLEKCAQIKENTLKHKRKTRNDGIVQTATQTVNSSISKNYLNSSLHADIKNSSAREFIGDKRNAKNASKNENTTDKNTPSNTSNTSNTSSKQLNSMAFMKQQLHEKKKINKTTSFNHALDSRVPRIKPQLVVENKTPDELLNEIKPTSLKTLQPNHQPQLQEKIQQNIVKKTSVKFQENDDKQVLKSKMKIQLDKIKNQNKKPKHKSQRNPKGEKTMHKTGPVTKLKPKKETITSSFVFDSTPSLVKEIKYFNKFSSLNIVPKFIKSHLQSKTVFVDQLTPIHETELPVDYENQLNELVQTLWRHKVHHNAITINKLFVNGSGNIVVTGFSEATKDNNCKTISPDKQRIQNIIIALKALMKTKQNNLDKQDQNDAQEDKEVEEQVDDVKVEVEEHEEVKEVEEQVDEEHVEEQVEENEVEEQEVEENEHEEQEVEENEHEEQEVEEQVDDEEQVEQVDEHEEQEVEEQEVEEQDEENEEQVDEEVDEEVEEEEQVDEEVEEEEQVEEEVEEEQVEEEQVEEEQVDEEVEEEEQVEEEQNDEEEQVEEEQEHNKHEEESEEKIVVKFNKNEKDDKEESKSDDTYDIRITKLSKPIVNKRNDRLKDFKTMNDFYDKKGVPPPKSSFKDLLSKYGNN